MQLAFFYLPVRDLKSTLAFYRDTLGWEEAWREGEATAAVRMPGTDMALMLDEDPNEIQQAGPFMRVASVDAFHREHAGTLRFVIEPRDIPPGRYAAFADPSGNIIRLLDATRDHTPGE